MAYLYGKDGSLVATYTLETFAKALEIDPELLVTSATDGYWRQGHPQFDETGQNLLINSGDKTLVINLETGDLTVS